MAKEPFEQFGMPKEIRAFVEQSVTQAKHAFDGFIQAANQAMGQFEGQAQAARGGANEIAHKSMAYAEQNMAATFELAEKLMQAKDATSAHELGIFCVLGLDPLILRLPSGGVLRRLYFLKTLRKREAHGP